MRVTKVDVTIPSSGYYLGYVSLVLDNAYTLNGVASPDEQTVGYKSYIRIWPNAKASAAKSLLLNQ